MEPALAKIVQSGHERAAPRDDRPGSRSRSGSVAGGRVVQDGPRVVRWCRSSRPTPCHPPAARRTDEFRPVDGADGRPGVRCRIEHVRRGGGASTGHEDASVRQGDGYQQVRVGRSERSRAVQVPVAGSKSSLAVGRPPMLRTRPSFSRTAVCSSTRAEPIRPVAAHVPVVGWKSSADRWSAVKPPVTSARPSFSKVADKGPARPVVRSPVGVQTPVAGSNTLRPGGRRRPSPFRRRAPFHRTARQRKPGCVPLSSVPCVSRPRWQDRTARPKRDSHPGCLSLPRRGPCRRRA